MTLLLTLIICCLLGSMQAEGHMYHLSKGSQKYLFLLKNNTACYIHMTFLNVLLFKSLVQRAFIFFR